MPNRSCASAGRLKVAHGLFSEVKEACGYRVTAIGGGVESWVRAMAELSFSDRLMTADAASAAVIPSRKAWNAKCAPGV